MGEFVLRSYCFSNFYDCVYLFFCHGNIIIASVEVDYGSPCNSGVPVGT